MEKPVKYSFHGAAMFALALAVFLSGAFPAMAEDRNSQMTAQDESAISLGARFGINLGQGSGKGYWDWTGTHQDGTLHPQPGYGGGVSLNWEVRPGLMLEGSLLYIRCIAGQTVDSDTYRYLQDVIEVPFMLKACPLFSERIYLGAGPSLVYLPSEGVREKNGTEGKDRSMSKYRFLAGVQAGMDIRLYEKARSSVYCNFRFSHPFIAPKYDWEEKGSGRFRINHFDLSLEFRGKLK